jgi:HAD superfamily hydrolase (TIGR01549 family)
MSDGVSLLQPIELVTFDLYDTLIELVPRRWERMATALQRIGYPTDVERLRDADLAAEDFYTEENTILPIRDRPRAERERFRLEYTERWLEAAELPTDAFTVRAAREAYLAEFETPAVERSVGFGYRAFDDVVPSLVRLREAGIKRAIISNADDDVTELCEHMAFAHEMDLIVTSAVVGWEKPDTRTFRAAFEPLGVDPARALHIGDQPRSDVVGARAAGMQVALIDRYERHDPTNHEVPVFTTLTAFVEAVLSPAPLARRGLGRSGHG